MNHEAYSIIQSYYELNNTLYYHKLEFCIIPEEDVYIDGWLGAALRNRLLFAAEGVDLMPGFTLRQIINHLPIKEEHPLYNELKGGFPKGYNLLLLSHQSNTFSCHIKKGETLRFALLLHGYYSIYYQAFIETIHKMCKQGFGKPIVRFQLRSVSEVDQDRKTYPLFNEDQSLIPPLEHPISLSGYINNPEPTDHEELIIRYEVPVNLHNNTRHKRENGYHDKQHEFPGFYPLIRAAAYRIAKLNTLYVSPKDFPFYPELLNHIEPFLQYAVTPILSFASLERIELCSTAKQGTFDRIQFSGYTGELHYQGHFHYYLPLLLFAQDIGIGNNATYGLGTYKINIINF